MNDSVLRGFCQKCGCWITYSNFEKNPKMSTYCIKGETCDVEWFLSAKQIKIVLESIQYDEFIKRPRAGVSAKPLWLSAMLEREPFLVARILADSVKEKCPNCDYDKIDCDCGVGPREDDRKK